MDVNLDLLLSASLISMVMQVCNVIAASLYAPGVSANKEHHVTAQYIHSLCGYA